jgi:hypothetical protein
LGLRSLGTSRCPELLLPRGLTCPCLAPPTRPELEIWLRARAAALSHAHAHLRELSQELTARPRWSDTASSSPGGGRANLPALSLPRSLLADPFLRKHLAKADRGPCMACWRSTTHQAMVSSGSRSAAPVTYSEVFRRR